MNRDKELKEQILSELQVEFESFQIRDNIIGIVMCTYNLIVDNGGSENEAWDRAIEKLRELEKDAKVNKLDKISTGNNGMYLQQQNIMNNAFEAVQASSFQDQDLVKKCYEKIFQKNDLMVRLAYVKYRSSLESNDGDGKKAFTEGLDVVGQMILQFTK